MSELSQTRHTWVSWVICSLYILTHVQIIVCLFSVVHVFEGNFYSMELIDMRLVVFPMGYFILLQCSVFNYIRVACQYTLHVSSHLTLVGERKSWKRISTLERYRTS